MRSIALLFLLFFIHNTSTGDTAIKTARAIAPGIALSMASGAAIELLSSYPKPIGIKFESAPNDKHILAAPVTSILGLAITAYNLKTTGYGYASLASLATFFAGFYFYITAAKSVGYVKNKYLALYKRRHPTKWNHYQEARNKAQTSAEKIKLLEDYIETNPK